MIYSSFLKQTYSYIFTASSFALDLRKHGKRDTMESAHTIKHIGILK